MPPDGMPKNAASVVALALEHGWTMNSDRGVIPWGEGRFRKEVESLVVYLARRDDAGIARVFAVWHDGSYHRAHAGFDGQGSGRSYTLAELRKIAATKDNAELREWVQAREAARLQAMKSAA